jgi:hypothetical protein
MNRMLIGLLAIVLAYPLPSVAQTFFGDTILSPGQRADELTVSGTATLEGAGTYQWTDSVTINSGLKLLGSGTFTLIGDDVTIRGGVSGSNAVLRVPSGSTLTGAIEGVSVETFDAGDSTPNLPEKLGESPLSNISIRLQVNGSRAAIAGFVVTGDLPRTVMIRAAGPALANFGVGGAMPNPKLTLTRPSGGAIAENGNWVAAIRPFFELTGAFSFEVGSLDAAIVTQLQPGAYTALVESEDGRGGEVLVEVYFVE